MKQQKPRKLTTRTKTGGDSNHFELKTINPKTNTQIEVFKSFSSKHLFLHGAAGTGKTYAALYLSLKELLSTSSRYNKIVIIRSAVPSRDIGFMPGTAAEKMEYYEVPYKDIVIDLLQRGDAYELLKKKNELQFMPTSFVRGITIDNALIILDEAQNLTSQEWNSVITRVGENSKLIICADENQDDLTPSKSKEQSGIKEYMNIMKKMPSVKFIEFSIDDVLRSGFDSCSTC